MNLESIARRCDFASRVAMLLLGVCLPLTTSGFEIVLGFAVIAWLASGQIKQRLRDMLRNRVAVLSLGLWSLFALGATVGSASTAEAWRGLMKYRELLCIPLLLSLFQKPDWQRFEKRSDNAGLVCAYRQWDPSGVRWRRWGLAALVIGTLISVAGSYVEWFIGRDIGFQARHDNVVFMDRIVQNLLVTYVIYLLAHCALDARRRQWAYAGVIAFLLFSLFALVPGRTGYVAFIALIGMLMWQRFRVRGLAMAAVTLTMLVAGAYFGSPMFRARMHQTAAQVRQYWSGSPIRDALSPEVEPRLMYFELTLQLIRRSPIVGHGTGGFERAYRNLASPAGLPVPAEPHNEYLAIASQIGLVGLAVWFWMLFEQWRLAGRLPRSEQHFAQALLVWMAFGCLTNSLLHGHTIGMTFAYLTGLLFSGGDAASAIRGADAVESIDVPETTMEAIPADAGTRRAA